MFEIIYLGGSSMGGSITSFTHRKCKRIRVQRNSFGQPVVHGDGLLADVLNERIDYF